MEWQRDAAKATTELSIRWLRVRVPSPSLKSRPQVQERQALAAFIIYPSTSRFLCYQPLFTKIHKNGTDRRRKTALKEPGTGGPPVAGPLGRLAGLPHARPPPLCHHRR